MTPGAQGYVKCARCGTVRPVSEMQGPWLSAWCLDVAWCSAQAGAGQGRLDADTGAPSKPSRVLLPFTPDMEDGS